MKILITGVNGQVGHALMRELNDHELIGLTRQDCDLTNPDQIKEVIDHYQPELIINPAAYTKVDQAEDEPELAFQINRDAPKVMAEKAREYNIPLIHFSTDYVFDGEKKMAYEEDDPVNPIGVYGKSKLAGENAVHEVGGKFFIFRTSWVYSNFGQNFYLTIKKLLQEKDELKIVNDQKGIPTLNLFIAKQINKIIPKLQKTNSGIFHLVPCGYCSWYEFAINIYNYSEIEKNRLILPIISKEFKQTAIRPKNSTLNNSKIIKTFNLNLKDWDYYLSNFMRKNI